MSGADRQLFMQSMNANLPKLTDPDPDLRFMALSDISTSLSSPAAVMLTTEFSLTTKLLDAIVKALQDQHGEVQAQALKCIAPLAQKLRFEQVPFLVNKLTALAKSAEVDLSLPNTAIRTIVCCLPRPSAQGGPPSKTARESWIQLAATVFPYLVGSAKVGGKKGEPGLLQYTKPSEVNNDALDILVEIVRCYGPLLDDIDIGALEEVLTRILNDDKVGVVAKKKSLIGLSLLSSYWSETRLSAFVSNLIESLRAAHLTPTNRRYLISAIGSLARSIPRKFGPYLKTIAPFVLHVLSQEELDEIDEDDSDAGEPDSDTIELRETALIALESLLGSCSAHMQEFLPESLDAAVRYVKYDPGVVEDEDMEDDDGDEFGGSDDEDEFADYEADDGLSDSDDISWKVRRCSLKVVYTIISIQTNALVSISEKIVPVLITRIRKEREDSVKNELLLTLTSIIRKSGGASTGAASDAATPTPSRSSRKRRRESDTSMLEIHDLGSPSGPSSPQSNPRVIELSRYTTSLIQGVVKIWKGLSVSSKQAAISFLHSLAAARFGGVTEHLQEIEPLIADALSSSAGSASGTSAASGTALQIEALALIASISESYDAASLVPFLVCLAPGIISAINDKNYKVSAAALGTVEQFSRALTVTKSTTEAGVPKAVQDLYTVLIQRITDNLADVEVRQGAISAFGVVIARTAGDKSKTLLSQDQVSQGLNVLLERLQNEITRLPAVRAITLICSYPLDKKDVDPKWVRLVLLELAAQLRKADRALRGSSLDALKAMVLNLSTKSHIDKPTSDDLVNLLLPHVSADDLHMLSPVLVILTELVPSDPEKMTDRRLITALCLVSKAPLTGSTMKRFLTLFQTIGQSGSGAPLMAAMLKDIGIGGDSTVVGRAIGTLTVYGGPNIGVSVTDFMQELQSSEDPPRKCLALAVLGEIGLRQGAESPLGPEVFMAYFESKIDKVRLAAAVALGNAGASNVQNFLPVVLQEMENSNTSTYLLLHSLRELLQHPDDIRSDVIPFAKKLWDRLLAASDAEDNRAIGSECIGRLALIEPKTYIPLLQDCLSSPNPAVRGTVMSAFRYTLTDNSSAFNEVLRSLIVPILETILKEQGLGNRKTALTAVNSAIHNKPELVLPSLSQIMPAIMSDTQIKKELVREVQMGPFRHKVDDGLDLRKSAYDILLSLLDPAILPHISLPPIFDRVVDGIADEADVRILCNLMVTRLIVLDPEETKRRLDALSDKFMKILTFKHKDTAVKQEIEKSTEANHGVLKVGKDLESSFPGAEFDGEHMFWKNYLDYARREWSAVLRGFEQDGAAANR